MLLMSKQEITRLHIVVLHGLLLAVCSPNFQPQPAWQAAAAMDEDVEPMEEAEEALEEEDVRAAGAIKPEWVRLAPERVEAAATAGAAHAPAASDVLRLNLMLMPSSAGQCHRDAVRVHVTWL